MATKFYIDQQGNYLGGFDGATPKVPALEVATPPEDARMVWDGNAWIIPDQKKEEIIDAKREAAYNTGGATIDQMVVALWKRVVEGDPTDSDAIEVIRKKVQADFPK